MNISWSDNASRPFLKTFHRGSSAKVTAYVAFAFVPFFLNSCLLSIFILRRNLWTPFDMYVVCLLTSNILFPAITGPLNTLAEIYPERNVGVSGCMIHIYAIAVIAAIQMLTHAVIALNRIWAMWMPISFHRLHSYKNACYTNLFVWLLAHVIVLPGAILDVLILRRPVRLGYCFMDWHTATDLLNTSISEIIAVACFLVIIVSFPLILWRQRVRALWKGKLGVMPQKKSQIEPKTKKGPSSAEQQTRALVIALVVSIIVFWGPSIGYYVYSMVYKQEYETAEQVTAALFNCQSIADPILMVLALPVWRRSVKEMLCRRR